MAIDPLIFVIKRRLSAVEMHNETIKQWACKINTTQFQTMDEVAAFVDRMDADMTATLTDEVVILRRVGEWPKRCVDQDPSILPDIPSLFTLCLHRYDTLREANASWKQLKDMESTFLNWSFREKNGVETELKRIQDHLEKTDAKVQSMMRLHQSEESKYREARVPWTTRLFDGVKLAALVPIELYLTKAYEHSLKLTSAEKQKRLFSSHPSPHTLLHSNDPSLCDVDCALFAFKGHQFVGGFNESCTQAFTQIERAAQPVMTACSLNEFHFPFSPENCVAQSSLSST